MTWREILALPVAIVLLGVDALLWKVGDLVTACGGGMAIMGVLLGVIVGIPFMLRMLRERDAMRQEWPPAPAIDGQWRQLPGDATPLSARRSVLSRLSRQPSVTSRPAV